MSFRFQIETLERGPIVFISKFDAEVKTKKKEKSKHLPLVCMGAVCLLP